MEIQARGTPAHTRTLQVGVFQDDAAHVEARSLVVDLRKRGLVPMAGDLQTNGVIHLMHVDARVSREGPRLAWIRADQPHVAFEPSEDTGGECCRDPVARIESLAGATLDVGFAKRLGAAIGGPRGCSHVLTVAQLLGSTVRSALEADALRFGETPPRRPGRRLFQRSLSIDGLEDDDHGLCLVLQLSDVHFAPVERVDDPLERLAHQREIRVQADVDLGRMALRRVVGAERLSAAGDAYDAAWQERDLSFLDGHPALGGMARTLFARLADSAEERPLRDALLNLAPGVIQCIPGLTRHWQRWREGGRETDGEGRPSLMAGGGMTDSCYMWRREGFLQQRMAETLRQLKS